MPAVRSIFPRVCLLMAFCAAPASAQSGQSAAVSAAPAVSAQTGATHRPARALPHATETMVVLGSPVPVPLAESTAAVVALPVTGKTLLLSSPQQLLREDSSVFLEERGAGGGQADIVLRGGTFEQALVLVDGFRINDSQTAHHDLDLPIPLDAIDSIEVLHGAGSTLHGEDALSGVVDFLTAAPEVSSLRLQAGGGSFGENEQSLLGALVGKSWSSRLAAERNFSTGFMADRDYRNEDAASETWINSRLGLSDLLVGASDRAFGANQFYGPYASWERTKERFAGARQELGRHTEAAFGYRRHTDEFILLRDDPAAYENNHIDGSWQAMLRHTIPVANRSVLLVGLEEDGDSIRSYNLSGGVLSYALGIHARNRGAGYADLDLTPARRRWSLSAGAREEIFSGGAQAVFSPHLAGGLRLSDQLRLRASGGYGFRLPTYTDLYYTDPATVGNPNLEPESAWSGEAGADWDPSVRLTISATGFYSRQHDTIDYVRALTLPNPLLPSWCPVDTWCAVNLSGLRFAGVESSATWRPAAGESIQVAWTALAGSQAPLDGLESEYALDYPVENLRAVWTAELRHTVTVVNTVAIVKDYQQPGTPPWNPEPYPVWDVDMARNEGRLRPYLRLGNLSNTGYEEIRGVALPGRSITGGLSFRLSR
ncbi:MAG: TonB-dependent receptor plug domain-containing protein [Terracidiphilus sp.]